MDNTIKIPDIKLNEQQKMVLSRLIKWWHHRSPLFQISGAAGTGKTTLIRFLIKEIGLSMDNVLFVAFVGKATLAMRMNGLNARTIHSAITFTIKEMVKDADGNPVLVNGDPQYRLKFIRKPELDEDIKLIVVDEGAMVPKKLAEWLMEYHIPIIVLGDLNQLPPVMGKSYFLQEVDCVLTDIMRQEKNSPIPYFANLIANGTLKRLKDVNVQNKVIIKPRSYLLDEEIKEANIMICHTNNHRDELNQYIRKEIFGNKMDYPMIGDKMICRENNWNKCICDDIYIINGMIGYVEDIDLSSILATSMKIDFRPEFLETEMFMNLTIDRNYLNISREEKKSYFSAYDKFEYGYCITCHLAQGSQYNTVIVDTSDIWNLNSTYGRQWLYTAVTRAIDKLIVVY